MSTRTAGRGRWTRAALVIAAGAAVCGGLVLLGTSPSPAEGPVAYTTMSEAQAQALFGVGDANGEGSLNAFTVEADQATGLLWAPVFTDEPQAQSGGAHLRTKGRERDARVEKASTDEVAVVYSQYSRADVEKALSRLGDLTTKESLTVSFGYSPIMDAIVVRTDGTAADSLPDEIAGVALIVESADVAPAT